MPKEVLTKGMLVQRISDKTQLIQPDVKLIVDEVFDILFHHISEGGRVELRQFGIFAARKRRGRLAHNPKNPADKVVIPDHMHPYFKPARTLRNATMRLPIS